VKPPRVLLPGEVLPPLPAPQTGQTRKRRAAARKPTPARRNSGRWGVLNAFVDVTISTLPRAALATWIVLFRDTRNGVARTGIASLTRRVGCDRRNILRALRYLVARGLVVVIHHGGRFRGCSSYRLVPVAPVQGDISRPEPVAPVSPLSRKNQAARATHGSKTKPRSIDATKKKV